VATRAILGPASVYTSHVDLASDKEVRFSSTTDPPVAHVAVAAPNVSVSPIVNVVASSAPKKVSLHLEGDDVTGVIVPGQGS
jgi:hypothetical protein